MSTKSIYPGSKAHLLEQMRSKIVIHHTTLADMLQAIPPLAPVYADRYDRSHREYQHLITHNVIAAAHEQPHPVPIVCVRAYICETSVIHSYTPIAPKPCATLPKTPRISISFGTRPAPF